MCSSNSQTIMKGYLQKYLKQVSYKIEKTWEIFWKRQFEFQRKIQRKISFRRKSGCISGQSFSTLSLCCVQSFSLLYQLPIAWCNDSLGIVNLGFIELSMGFTYSLRR